MQTDQMSSPETIDDQVCNPSEEEAVQGRQSLTEIEVKIIEVFVHITKLLAIPKSVGEIYGLLYCSAEPITVADITAKLGISKATASYALKFLANINAIQVSKEFGIRHDLYTAETSLRKLTFGFLSERVEPFVQERDEDLKQLVDLSEKLPNGSADEKSEKRFLKERIRMLSGWQRNARGILPLVRNFFKMTR
tara:strand:- start:8487 stop:9068 length:582 start_codon:yes stop_codon:yes gene_type:complete